MGGKRGKELFPVVSPSEIAAPLPDYNKDFDRRDFAKARSVRARLSTENLRKPLQMSKIGHSTEVTSLLRGIFPSAFHKDDFLYRL